jgi:hypothetical protein
MKCEMEDIALETMLQYYPEHKREKPGPPSPSWLREFMTRHDLCTTEENPLERDRSENATVGNIKHWFDLIGKEVDMTKFHPCMRGNLDETRMDTKGRSLVVVKKGTRFAVTQDLKSNEGITVFKCIITESLGHTPMFILPLKNVPKCLDKLVETQKCMIAGQTNGWITQELFEQYMKSFAEFLKGHRAKYNLPPDAPFLLFSDSHSSRKDWDMLNFLKENHITMVTFPSHCTHILQPLDVGVYGVFKKYYRQEIRRLSRLEIGCDEINPSKATVLRYKKILAAIEALHLSCSPLQVEKSFKHAGLVPWSVDAALRNPRINPSEAITLESRKRKGINMDGRVVTSQIFLDELKKHEQEAKTKPKNPKNFWHIFLTIRKTKKGDIIDVDALALTEEVEILEELPPTIMCDPNNPTKFTIRLPGI